MIRAVVCGTNSVDPRYYDGWNGGPLLWPVQDALKFADKLRELAYPQPIDIAVLIHKDWTPARTLEELFHRAQRMDPDRDEFVGFVSGHGTQEPDRDGDEPDGYDEVICAHGGKIRDDFLGQAWRAFPARSPCWWVADTCHSATGYRGGPGGAAARGRFSGGRFPLTMRSVMRCGFEGQLIAMTGCDDDRVSYDGRRGGEFTEALLTTWGNGPWERSWLDRALRRNAGVDRDDRLGWTARLSTLVRRDQRPHYEEWGAVTDEFRRSMPGWRK